MRFKKVNLFDVGRSLMELLMKLTQRFIEIPKMANALQSSAFYGSIIKINSQKNII